MKTKKRFSSGFTLVELVIVIAIVIVLSVVSVPIYKSYVDKAKMTEGYTLLATIITAQKAYYSEYGNFLRNKEGTNGYSNYNPFLGVDARGNKYFTWFSSGAFDYDTETLKFQCYAQVYKPEDLVGSESSILSMTYNITTGLIYS